MLQVLDAAAIRRWASASVDVLDAHRAELNRINVFPVPDGDTGTNLALTLYAAAEELARRTKHRCDTAAEVAAALAHGALRGARGNSGVIVSQLARGLAEALAGNGADRADLAEGPDRIDGADGPVLAAALRRADELARTAVSRPVEGTVLSVLRAASVASTEAAQAAGTLSEVAASAARGSAAALADTPRQLPVLARAGVVDAGGLGMVLLLEALVAVVTGRPLPVEGGYSDQRSQGDQQNQQPRDRAALIGERESGSVEFDYEVMYLLDGSTDQRVEALRARLDELGDSVAVVSDGSPEPATLWNVHVHCTDVGAVVEAGIRAGRPHRITVVRFTDQADGLGGWAGEGRFTRPRGVVTVVSGEPLVELVSSDGVTALVAEDGRQPDAGELAAAVAGTRARHVVVLPNDVALTPVAEQAADLARAAGQEVVVVPTSSVLQGLAALAVHDAERRPGDDVVAMAEAAAVTRTGVVRIASGEALTWAGHCYAGDVLGLVDGEVVLIERELETGACQLADRMLTTGGELVTVLLGEDSPDELGELLTDHLRYSHPEVEVVCYRGGPAQWPVQLGVE